MTDLFSGMHGIGSVVPPPRAAQLYPNMRAAPPPPMPIIAGVLSAVNARSPGQILRPTRHAYSLIDTRLSGLLGSKDVMF